MRLIAKTPLLVGPDRIEEGQAFEAGDDAEYLIQRGYAELDQASATAPTETTGKPARKSKSKADE